MSRSRTTSAPIDVVGVVVPVCNEEALLARCLDAVAAAVEQTRDVAPQPRVEVVVVLDRCTDRSADIVADRGLTVLTVDHGMAGAARRAGVDHFIRSLEEREAAERAWVASTDADSRVGPDWLADQVQAANGGATLVLGRAIPDAADMSPRLHAAWHRRHADHETAMHVHGANLGLRLDVYLASGGFPAIGEHEDAELVSRARALGVTIAVGVPVITSGRLEGRTPGGFAGYLTALSDLPALPAQTLTA